MDKKRMERHLRFLACFYPLNARYNYMVSWMTSSKAVWFRCTGPTPNFPRFSFESVSSSNWFACKACIAAEPTSPPLAACFCGMQVWHSATLCSWQQRGIHFPVLQPHLTSPPNSSLVVPSMHVCCTPHDSRSPRDIPAGAKQALCLQQQHSALRILQEITADCFPPLVLLSPEYVHFKT